MMELQERLVHLAAQALKVHQVLQDNLVILATRYCMFNSIYFYSISVI
jgi:hypothetical protein